MGLNLTEDTPMESRQLSEEKLKEYEVDVLALLERHNAQDLVPMLGLTREEDVDD